jgi:hypothetical protein
LLLQVTFLVLVVLLLGADVLYVQLLPILVVPGISVEAEDDVLEHANELVETQ